MWKSQNSTEVHAGFGSFADSFFVSKFPFLSLIGGLLQTENSSGEGTQFWKNADRLLLLLLGSVCWSKACKKYIFQWSGCIALLAFLFLSRDLGVKSLDPLESRTCAMRINRLSALVHGAARDYCYFFMP